LTGGRIPRIVNAWKICLATKGFIMKQNYPLLGIATIINGINLLSALCG